jgi:hypothetical protein
MRAIGPGSMTPQGTVRLQTGDRAPPPNTEPLFNLAAKQAGSSAYEDIAFKNRLQPTILGVPAPVAVLFATGGFLIIALVAWILLR